MKRLISLFLTFILIITLLPAAVFAYEFEDDDTPDKLPNAVGHRNEAVMMINYTSADTLPNGRFGVLFPYKLTPGLYEVNMSIHPLYDYEEPYIIAHAGLYEDDELIEPVNAIEVYENHVITSTAAEQYSRSMIFRITSERDYYLTSYCDDPDISKMDVYLTLNRLSDPASGIKAPKDYGVFPDDTAKPKVLSYTAAHTGYIELWTTSATRTALTTKAGKVVSKQYKAGTGYPVFFGVKKGVKYKLSIAWPTNGTEAGPTADYGYALEVRKGSVPLTGGKRRSQAALLKLKKAKSGLIAAGDSGAKWYGFKVTKKKRISIRVKGGTCNKIKLSLYKEKGTKPINTKYISYASRAEVTPIWWEPSAKLAPGHYYIKVQRSGTTSSGWYNLQWRYR